MKNRKYITEELKQSLFQDLGVKYIKECEVHYKDLFTHDWKASSYFIQNEEEFAMLNKKYGSLIKEHFYAPTAIATNPQGMGYGLFSLKELKKGDFIGEYTGAIDIAKPERALNKEETRYSTDFAWDYPDELEETPPLEINALHMGNELRFVNHSFTPNCDVEHTLIGNQWHLFFIANTDIQEGEELFVDYGEDYWTTAKRELIL